MRARYLTAAWVLVLAFALAGETRAQDGGAARPLPACMGVATQSRYVPFGYNHIVVVTNGCSKAAACVVATDVNPAPQNVNVASGTTAEVTTFLGAAASAFTANVSCQLR